MPRPPPAISPAALAHFAAIQACLTPEERGLAQAVATELPPAEIRAWMAQLSELSVDEAVMLIRKTMSATKGGVS